MASSYGEIRRSKECNSSELELLLPIEAVTKRNQVVSIHSVTSLLQRLEDPSNFLSFLQSLLNKEIEAGNTYPQKFPLNLSEFKNYFLSADAYIVVNGAGKSSFDFVNNLEQTVLGIFYIKPNFPGRCSHICNGGFITSSIHRGQGIGKIMGSAFVKIAPLLGYQGSMFNLVFNTNLPSVRLWRSLGFQEIGIVPKAGYLKKRTEPPTNTNADIEEEYVDAIMFYYSFH